LAIVAAAAGESTVPPGELPGKKARRKYWIAGVVSCVVLVLALVGGKKWWAAEEADFRTRLHDGGWPDLKTDVRTENSQRILRLTVGEKDFGPRDRLSLTTDHGKLLHLFLVAQPNKQAFGHLHPVRQGNNTFDVTLPPLPEGDYQVFCDLTFESGLSSTATNFVHLSPVLVSTGAADMPDPMPDPDDSWATDSAVAVRDNPGSDAICHLADGTQVIWKAHPSLESRKDAALRFQVLDKAGQPVALQPYMGMMSHAAVLRSDGRVFAHLHPSGNFSMAAQMFFDAKVTKETGVKSSDYMASMPEMAGMDGMSGSMNMTNMDHSMMGGSMQTQAAPDNSERSTIALPYQFPTPGDYRLWIQIKVDDQIKTAIFDTTVK
jgi:hypothetical protein